MVYAIKCVTNLLVLYGKIIMNWLTESANYGNIMETNASFVTIQQI